MKIYNYFYLLEDIWRQNFNLDDSGCKVIYPITKSIALCLCGGYEDYIKDYLDFFDKTHYKEGNGYIKFCDIEKGKYLKIISKEHLIIILDLVKYLYEL